jgi:hypothetical protein
VASPQAPRIDTRQNFNHLLNANGREVLTPGGTGHWRVRFTPTEAGTWNWSTAVSIDGGPASTSPTNTFACDADPSSHGFLRRSPDDSRQLRWDDGSPYLAIGENLAWYRGREGTFAYDDWLDELAAHGATWMRVWMPVWAFGLETITRDDNGIIVQNSLGDYTTRLDRAWQLDDVAKRQGNAGSSCNWCCALFDQPGVGVLERRRPDRW